MDLKTHPAHLQSQKNLKYFVDGFCNVFVNDFGGPLSCVTAR